MMYGVPFGSSVARSICNSGIHVLCAALTLSGGKFRCRQNKSISSIHYLYVYVALRWGSECIGIAGSQWLRLMHTIIIMRLSICFCGNLVASPVATDKAQRERVKYATANSTMLVTMPTHVDSIFSSISFPTLNNNGAAIGIDCTCSCNTRR